MWNDVFVSYFSRWCLFTVVSCVVEVKGSSFNNHSSESCTGLGTHGHQVGNLHKRWVTACARARVEIHSYEWDQKLCFSEENMKLKYLKYECWVFSSARVISVISEGEDFTICSAAHHQGEPEGLSRSSKSGALMSSVLCLCCWSRWQKHSESRSHGPGSKNHRLAPRVRISPLLKIVLRVLWKNYGQQTGQS